MVLQRLCHYIDACPSLFWCTSSKIRFIYTDVMLVFITDFRSLLENDFSVEVDMTSFALKYTSFWWCSKNIGFETFRMRWGFVFISYSVYIYMFCLGKKMWWQQQNIYVLQSIKMPKVTVCVRFRPLSPKEGGDTGRGICVNKIDFESFAIKVFPASCSILVL